MTETQKFDLSGLDTIDVWCKLPEGATLKLINGAEAEIIANPQDGGFILGRFTEHPQDPSKVGEEDYIFFNEVKEAVA